MKRISLVLLISLLVLCLIGCTSNNDETNQNDDNPDIKPVDTNTLFDNSNLNIYILASESNNSVYYTQTEIESIKNQFASKIKNPELINYQVISNSTVSEFGTLVKNNNDADIILAGSNMDSETGANITLKTEPKFAKIALHSSWYSSSSSRYIGISQRIEDEKLATALMLRELLINERITGKLYSILFIGNSYTYYNDLYRMYEEMAASFDIEVKTKVCAKGSAFISDYIEGAKYHDELVSILQNNQFDIIYLQEQSSKSGKNYSGFLSSAKSLAQTIRTYQENATLCMYETWARDERNSFYTENPIFTYHSMTYAIADNYKKVAKVIEADIAYAGLGFYEIYTKHKDIELYQPDYTHPSPRGSYLVALTLLKTSFGVDPLNVNYIPSYTTSVGVDKVMPTLSEIEIIKNVVANVSY